MLVRGVELFIGVPFLAIADPSDIPSSEAASN